MGDIHSTFTAIRLAALLAVATLVALPSCSAEGQDPPPPGSSTTAAPADTAAPTTTASENPTDPGEPTAQALDEARITIRHADGKASHLTVEVADSQTEREKGLMFRRNLEDDHGMLFVFPQPADHGFWMKNTPLPLDMIFIDSSRRVAAIISGARPHSTEVLRAGVPSRYVLEVNAGWAEEVGLRVGDQIIFESGQTP
ncbi:MAG: hypothetical protein Kow00129_12650 [Thermoleophilia bacterium]